MKLKWLSLTALMLLAFPLLAAQRGALTVTWSGAEIVVSGVTPHGEVSLIAAMHSRSEYRGRIFRLNEQLVDDDGDGVVRVATPADQALTSLVIAIDERTGEYAAGARDGAAPLMRERDYQIERDKNGHFADVRLNAHSAQAVVVRPGRGSWRASMEATGRIASGQFQSGLFIPLARLSSHVAGAPPDVLLPNDLLVVVDEEPLQAVIHRETQQ